ncbi:MAG: CAP domain-containing protein [Gaiellaceae bacterium]
MNRLLVMLLCAAAAFCAVGAAAATQGSERRAGIASLLVERINAFRAERGLAPVRPAPSLRLAALSHTRDQTRRGVFAHRSPDGTPFADRIARFYGKRGFTRWSVGENLLFGPVSIGPDEALEAWLASPPHRRLLLEPRWRDVGIVALVADAAPGDFGGRNVVVITSDFGARVR